MKQQKDEIHELTVVFLKLSGFSSIKKRIHIKIVLITTYNIYFYGGNYIGLILFDLF